MTFSIGNASGTFLKNFTTKAFTLPLAYPIQEFGAKLFRSFFEVALTLANATKAPKS